VIVIIETSFLYALVDKNDKNHKKAAALIQEKASGCTFVVPFICIQKTCQLINANMSGNVEYAFLNGVLKDFNIEFANHEDLARSLEIMARYEKESLSFYDACLTAFAESLKTNLIFGFDLKNLEKIAPHGFKSFKLNANP